MNTFASMRRIVPEPFSPVSVTSELIHVAVGVVRNARDEILISRRHPGSHLGGLWEFPGGKLETGESVVDGLTREFAEELGLRVLRCSPMMRVSHRYPDKYVLLDVWSIDAWEGEASGLEGQPICFRPAALMRHHEFPAADAPIINRLSLPAEIAITPDTGSPRRFESVLGELLGKNISCILVRQTKLGPEEYLEWFARARAMAGADCTLLFHQGIDAFASLATTAGIGYHCNGDRLGRFQNRPVAAATLLSASCHDLDELNRAANLGVDLAFLSPVREVKKQGREPILGWPGFAALAAQVDVPLYALGGVERSDLDLARASGGHGIAGIAAFLTGTP